MISPLKESAKPCAEAQSSLHHGIKRQQRYVAEAITEEWRMAPGPLEVAWFAEETAAVERAVDALTKRLEKLEAK